VRLLTPRETAALRCLDECCWDDCEQGGGGWVGIAGFAESYGVTYGWASQLLSGLRAKGFAESRRGKRLTYALSEAGGAYLHPDTTKEGTPDAT
jgi:DNA-binding IscR family transcriptional regulator